MCGVVRVKVGIGVIVIVIVIWFDLKCMIQRVCAFIHLCFKRRSQTSRLRIGNGEYMKGYKIHRVKKFNNMIRMGR